MNKELKEFKKYKKSCSRKLFNIIDKNPLKKEIKELEYSEDNLKRIKAISEKLHTIPEIRYNKFLYIFIEKMLSADRVDRFYKLLECDNFLNYNPLINEHSDFYTRKDALKVVDTKWIEDDNFNLYLEMINNKLFLKNNINNAYIKSKIISVFCEINNKKSARNLVDIATDANYWNKYDEVEEYYVIDTFEKDKNNAKYTQLISVLSHKNYFRDDKYLSSEILCYTKKFTIRNYDGLIQLVSNLSDEEFLDNSEKLYKIIRKISETKYPRHAIELASIASNPTFLNNDIQEIDRLLRRMENKEILEKLKKELENLPNTDNKQKQFTKK